MEDRVESTVSVLLSANKTYQRLHQLIDMFTEHIYSSGCLLDAFGQNTTLVSINSRYLYLQFPPQFPHPVCLTGLENTKMEYCKIAFI